MFKEKLFEFSPKIKVPCDYPPLTPIQKTNFCGGGAILSAPDLSYFSQRDLLELK